MLGKVGELTLVNGKRVGTFVVDIGNVLAIAAFDTATPEMREDARTDLHFRPTSSR